MGPIQPVTCPIYLTVGASSCYSAFVRKFFPKKFPSSHFPLLTSLSFSLPSSHPSEVAPWHHSPCSKTERSLRRSSVFEEQRLIEALNQAGIFTGEFSSLSPCPYFSLPFPGATLSPRCSKSVSLPFHFPCPWSGSGLGFSLDVKGVFDLFY